MDQLITALVGLMGALVGAGASVTTIAIQSHYQAKRERMKLVADLAIHDHKNTTEIMKTYPGGGGVPPLSLYVDYYASIARIVESRPLTINDIKHFRERIDELMAALPEVKPRRTN